MEQLRDEETIRRLRNRLETHLNTTAKSVVDALCVFTDLLIEITRPGAEVGQKPKEATKAVSEMLTTKEAAEYLGLKPSTLASWRCTGRHSVPYVKVGGNTRYRKVDLEKFLQQRTMGHTGTTDSW